jgi:hypothetical protein
MEDIQTEQTEQTETQEAETEPKRSRRKSARRALEDCCDRLESVIKSPNQKPAKVIDALQTLTTTRLRLLDYDTAKASDAAIAENETLRQRHEQGVTRIAELESKLETARSIRTTASATSDPRIAEQKQTIDNLKSLVKFLASEFPAGDPAKMAIAVILKFGKTAREYVTGLGIDFDAYFSNLNSSSAMTEANLKASVNPPEDEPIHDLLNRPVVGVDFAVAALAVVHQITIKAPVRRVSGSNARDYAALAADEFND